MIITNKEKELYEIIMMIYDEYHLNDIKDFEIILPVDIAENEYEKMSIFVDLLNDFKKDLGLNIIIKLMGKENE